MNLRNQRDNVFGSVVSVKAAIVGGFVVAGGPYNVDLSDFVHDHRFLSKHDLAEVFTLYCVGNSHADIFHAGEFDGFEKAKDIGRGDCFGEDRELGALLHESKLRKDSVERQQKICAFAEIVFCPFKASNRRF